MHRAALAIGLLAVLSGNAGAATPPDAVNFQGVLRDPAGNPLDGELSMTFRLWSAASSGHEILIDGHSAVNLQGVTVDEGLVNVALGTGSVSDGSGPGSYTTLGEVFRDYGEVWLEIQVESEVLSPRIRFASTAYAMNTMTIGGKTATDFVDTSTTGQVKSGKLVVGASSGSAAAFGLEAYGVAGGGYFQDLDGTSSAAVGQGGIGITAFGTSLGGYFQDLVGGAYARVAYGEWGIEAHGNAGGAWFSDDDASGYSLIGWNDYGIRAFGNYAGGYFKDLDHSGEAYLGIDDYGIKAYATGLPGLFSNTVSNDYAWLASGSGIQAGGTLQGGYFLDRNESGEARIAYGDYGVHGYGNFAGGYFECLDLCDGQAWLGDRDRGIWARGSEYGGYFNDTDSSSFARVAYGAYKIAGSGTVSFVQNHPDDASKVVVYHAPEASEVAVYARGRATIRDGSALVALDETFRWVANPDLGLTAHLTPRGPAPDLHVVSVSTEELVVAASKDVEFDYMVWGLRIGFEEMAPVQPKREEAYIPSMEEPRAMYLADAALASYNAGNRFRAIEARSRRVDPSKLDLSRARELRARIGEYGPELRAAAHDPRANPRLQAEAESVSFEHPVSPRATSRAERAANAGPLPTEPASAAVPDREPRDTGAAAVWVSVSEPVEAGDALALDPDRPGALRRSATLADRGIVGVAVGSSMASSDGALEAPVAASGIVTVNVDPGYGAILPGDLLMASPTPGHAMVALDAAPGTVLGKALEGAQDGPRSIRIVVMLR